MAQERIIGETRIIGMGWCPLVLGECVQGQTPQGQHFLITSPIGLFSAAEFTQASGDKSLSVTPANRWKAHAAIHAFLAEQRLPHEGSLRIVTPLGPGQGFGTSTADITASLRAVAAACNRNISAKAIARIAISLEPSDGSMYSGCVAFAHRDGLLLERLGSLPRFEALVVCTGGTVDTVEFDKYRRHFRYTEKEQSELMMAWDMVRHANRIGDTALLAQATTLSAHINQRVLPKPHFREITDFVERARIDGIMVAHSGTAIALILDPLRSDYSARLAEARAFVAALEPPAWFQTSNYAVYRRVPAMYTKTGTVQLPGKLFTLAPEERVSGRLVPRSETMP